MLETISSVLLFIVLAIGVWTIICMVHKEPWVYDLFVKPKYKQVKFDAWVAADKDGFIGVFNKMPYRIHEDGGKWDTDAPNGFIMCANDRLKPFVDTFDIKWEDEPLKATFIIEVTMTELKKAKANNKGE